MFEYQFGLEVNLAAAYPCSSSATWIHDVSNAARRVAEMFAKPEKPRKHRKAHDENGKVFEAAARSTTSFVIIYFWFYERARAPLIKRNSRELHPDCDPLLNRLASGKMKF
jgi:hypothetical protein